VNLIHVWSGLLDKCTTDDYFMVATVSLIGCNDVFVFVDCRWNITFILTQVVNFMLMTKDSDDDNYDSNAVILNQL